MVQAEGSALVRQPLPGATRAAHLPLHAIIPLYHTIQIPAVLSHPAHKKQAHRSGPAVICVTGSIAIEGATPAPSHRVYQVPWVPPRGR